MLSDKISCTLCEVRKPPSFVQFLSSRAFPPRARERAPSHSNLVFLLSQVSHKRAKRGRREDVQKNRKVLPQKTALLGRSVAFMREDESLLLICVVVIRNVLNYSCLLRML